MTTLAPPDVERAYVTYLGANMAVPVSTRVPNPRPASLVRVQVIGGDAPSVALDAPRILIECWAAAQGDAIELARQAWALIAETRAAWVSDVWVSSVALSRPVNFPDPLTTSPRYQFTADLRVAMTPVT